MTYELNHTQIKAIDKLRKHGSKIRFSEGTEKIIRVDAIGDSQMQGEYVAESLFIIDGKIYARVKDQWELDVAEKKKRGRVPPQRPEPPLSGASREEIQEYNKACEELDGKDETKSSGT